MRKVITSSNIDFTTYSAVEQIVGKWIDGKNIYRKTVTVPGGFTNGENNVPHQIYGLSLLIDINGIGYEASTGKSLKIPSRATGNPFVSFWTVDSNVIKIEANFNYNNPLYITLYYTKTIG